jgi:hypothetical protein
LGSPIATVANPSRCLGDLRFVVVSIEEKELRLRAMLALNIHQRAASLRYTHLHKRILFCYAESLHSLSAPFGRGSSAAALLTPISNLHMPTPTTTNITYAKVPADREPHNLIHSRSMAPL